MARTRIIKPDFFANEEMLQLSFPARLLFIALWTMSDRRGRLEDRPLKIRRESFPYEDVNIDPLLEELRMVGFIVRYESEGQKCIHVVNFERHQNPHKNEVESELPAPPLPTDSRKAPSGSGNPGTTPVLAPCPDPDPCPDRDEQKAPPAPGKRADEEEGTIYWVRRMYRPLWREAYPNAPGAGWYPDDKSDHTAWDNHFREMPEAERRAIWREMSQILRAFLADKAKDICARRHRLFMLPSRILEYRTGPPKPSSNAAAHKPLDVEALLR